MIGMNRRLSPLSEYLLQNKINRYRNDFTRLTFSSGEMRKVPRLMDCRGLDSNQLIYL